MFQEGLWRNIHSLFFFFYYLKATLADIRENSIVYYENKKLIFKGGIDYAKT